jgi:hypothetical protein
MFDDKNQMLLQAKLFINSIFFRSLSGRLPYDYDNNVSGSIKVEFLEHRIIISFLRMSQLRGDG